MDPFNELLKSQATTEELMLQKYLIFQGNVGHFDIIEIIDSLKDNKDIVKRNKYIKIVADFLRGENCSLKPHYAFLLLSKTCNLSPAYIQKIANSEDPSKWLKNQNIIDKSN